ncbi:DUF3000 domain-containing protein [Goodfellowiella coeruleoviolacea]|uniref:DUF3000 domain-containing protein n=1 Tax=Goodfellowiella coeruleoviolacea TaxID=334858 RepID=UPI000A54DDF8|nr:DUF3000 domain-containing protein [Goodfellowiella coeruleoviolacea]
MTGTSSAEAEVPELFRTAVTALRSLRPRPEMELGEVRPPQRLAPWAFALTGEVNGAAGELSTGRLILLHDPEGAEAWDGVLRLVAYVRVELDPELAGDPLLPEVGWSWLTEALDNCGADWTALGGTVTQTSSARFGDIAGPARTDDLELRASWTAVVTDGHAELSPHGAAFCELMTSAVGLPPVGVSMLDHHRPG